MNDFINKLYKNNAIIYKVLLFLITVTAIVYLFPKGGQFKYDFPQGKPWQYDNLYSPFDFAIQKTDKEKEEEIKNIEANAKKYFVVDTGIKTKVLEEFEGKIIPSDSLSIKEVQFLKKIGKSIINSIYRYGLLDAISNAKANKRDIVILRKGNSIEDVPFSRLIQSNEVLSYVNQKVKDLNVNQQQLILRYISETLRSNVSYDVKYSERELQEALNSISLAKGKVSKGELIILKGDIVEGKKFNVLKSYELASSSQIWTESNYNWIVFGYTILVSLALLMLLLFLEKYRLEIYKNNNKVTFIFFNIFLMIFVQTMVVKYNSEYLYVVPLSILPIVLKAFFDARLGLFTHVLTVLLLGFIVPNSFEFIYLHIIAGIVTILTVSELYKRASLFVSIGQITLIYMITYFAFSILKEGNADKINWLYFGLFAANGLLSFLAVFFIYFYEKLFGLVSDVTLLELSNTNSKLLRDLNEKAPGTFQHSMQVANLAEAAANEIGANSMLVRTGALYHDIGKMVQPMYFTENQSTGVNPHNDLLPKDSARIILDHVINGIEIAKKNKLPDRIIDFIRTHHGTSVTYYFYKKEQENNPDEEIDIKKFQYQGPIPFSKETAILMMCDAAEAASKSLKNPTAQSIDELIDKIINKQKNDNQFRNSDITFREIEKIKKIIKNKLMNIYHLRVEYPD
ncbi:MULTISPECIES: HD family phosphohydrolase [unclassified Tenacibaculum]|uniref:HD family phosphohydrolase n=1 Tax=unclassified Tenacibaculum TaxID=2635139 RepID=UPI001F1F22CB|nr:MULTISPECIES: HDIG domain-containing metalloprotein [unclassified Tenacibaculum]MCF2873171.1 HDIG domain-containing protein [Tenacibaculum sp. Cn5-1]MCF2933327.1 HDIG domain-containing protein [Tenacibaculum sp. Cn5-34]MCG7510092.1 HDIG domain-containing protein [Tenacibaculum sp. Cn5-46]